MFILSRSFLEKPTRFQTKMGKVYTRCQTKTAQKPYPMGRHIYLYGVYKGVSPRALKLGSEGRRFPPAPPPVFQWGGSFDG